MKSRIRTALQLGAVLSLLLLVGCVESDSFGGSRDAISAWGEGRGFVVSEVLAGPFQLLRLTRGGVQNGGIAAVYIEGDGAPWPSPWYPPHDPTPFKPIAMTLAAADPASAVAYFGRPCQYLQTADLAACSPLYWRERRFSPEVIAAYNDALNEWKKASGAQQLRLVGYSGGGVITTLLAARRSDVELLVTVAAPLVISEWIAEHGLSPLKGSLDPADLSSDIQLPLSVHFIGDHDQIVSNTIVKHFVARYGGRIITIPNFGHECCWSHHWSHLIERIIPDYISSREHAK